MIANAAVLVGIGGPTAYLCAAVVAHELREHRRRTTSAARPSPARSTSTVDQRAA